MARAARRAEEPNPELQAELDALHAALTAGVPEEAEDRDDDQRARWLMAQLIDYHRREAKPAGGRTSSGWKPTRSN